MGVKKELHHLEAADAKQEAESDEDEYEQIAIQQQRRPTVKKGSECPYLDTISRQVSIFAMVHSKNQMI